MAPHDSSVNGDQQSHTDPPCLNLVRELYGRWKGRSACDVDDLYNAADRVEAAFRQWKGAEPWGQEFRTVIELVEPAKE